MMTSFSIADQSPVREEAIDSTPSEISAIRAKRSAPNSSRAETPVVKKVADALLPTVFGEFRIAAFSPSIDGKEHTAIYCGNLGADDEPVVVRVHSECLTGDIMGSLRCDCRQQLHKALQEMAEAGKGVLLYMRQEGRGIGLTNKIKAYTLQEQGMDTVQANHALGFEDDERSYEVAAAMLKAMGIGSIILKTNNPKKIAGLKAHGIEVVDRKEHAIAANPHNRAYLQTKRERSGHWIPPEMLALNSES